MPLHRVPLRRVPRRAVSVAVVLALVAAAAVTAGFVAFGGPSGKHVTAYFDRTVGVYAGSDLRILGVKVGTVESVKPQGKQVKVSLRLDHGIKVPAKAGAVVVAPSVVADRYVQLTPAYTGGAQLADHGVIPASRTATPVEIDQLYASVTQLSKALGPDGANTNGALSNLLDVGAQNLKGNGKDIGDSIDQLGQATKTLDGHSDDLFSTLAYLQSFTTMLKDNDGKVKAATDQLSTVSGFLADDKEDLGGALQQLSTALGSVKTFIQDNRSRLKASIAKLTPITQTLVDQRASLAELLDDAPLAADNLLNTYDPKTGTLDGRADINELSLGGSVDPTDTAGPAAVTKGTAGTTAKATGTTASKDGSGAASGAGDTPPLPLPPVGTVYGGTTGTTTGKGAAQ
ncbi:putative mce5D Mce family protein [Actinacidiphila reveromycinica]|uniref:Putative mce5D Mce family protein n=1 Tax=Actinacidiphila reveromycinica TaxID=659352 RepID=A0A7U3VMW6_9ACTN|nr:putative mce5D Mce family protein [Streptomyces sp. SN-593]